MKCCLAILTAASAVTLAASTPAATQNPLRIVVATQWPASEGQQLTVPLNATGGTDSDYTFTVADPELMAAGITTSGNTLRWIPGNRVASAASPTALVRIPPSCGQQQW